MGCFLACFGSSKEAKRQKQRIHVLPRGQRNGTFKPVESIVSRKQESTEQSISQVSETRVLSEQPLREPLSFSARKKVVTFDSNVTTYEPVSVHGSIESLPETEKKGKEENSTNSSQSNLLSKDDSKTSSSGSYPPDHRYHNYRESDDEEDELQFGDSDLDVDDDEFNDSDEEDDGISPSQAITEDVDPRDMAAICPSPQRELKTNRVNPNARDRSAYVHPVLNPVENLAQWKAVKGKGTPSPLKVHQKENLSSDQEPLRPSFSLEPSFSRSLFNNESRIISEPENPNQDMAVNASLSNWLVSPETTTPSNKTTATTTTTTTSNCTISAAASANGSSQKGMSYMSNSPRSQEDRPILGALTLEEIRQFSASNSPRKSPNRSPDDMPIVGTVGTYWSHTGTVNDSDSASSSYKGIPNTTSKYREDKRVNWHSTPFEARLERALNNNGAIEA